MTTIGDDVLATPDCDPYGTDSTGTPFPTCPFCSKIPLNTHDEFTCYMEGEDDSYGDDEQDLCNWKCLRCDGPSEADCIACKPGLNLEL